ncbi:MAG: ATP-binding protein [Cyanobacteria bacterium P01_F01_bin.116]
MGLNWVLSADSGAAMASTGNAFNASNDKNVLVIHSYNPEYPWTNAQKEGIDQGFQNEAQNVTVYHEFLDAKRYPDLHHQEAFLDYVQTKYEDTSLSVMMVSDDPGLNLILAKREMYFPTLPIVFLGINQTPENVLNQPLLTGVFEANSNVETVVEAARQTGSDRVIVISDDSSTSQGNLRRLKAGLLDYEQAPAVIEVKDIVTSEIESRLGGYDDRMPIFLAGQLREGSATGSLMQFWQGARLLRSQLPNPLYTSSRSVAEHGTVGGKVLDGNYHAQQAVDLAQTVLDGTPVSDIAPILEADNQWVFDAQELKRVKIDTALLPPESVLINEKPSFYSRYPTLVWVVSTLFGSGIITITVMTYAIRRQHKAEQELREHEKQLEQRVHERTTQLIQTEKMSNLGQLVGGVAHELNNPLSFLSGNVLCMGDYVQDLLSTLKLYQHRFSLVEAAAEQSSSAELSAAEAICEHTEEIDLDYIQEDMPKVLKSIFDGAERIQNIVVDLQSFSRCDEQGCKPTDIHRSIDSTLNMLGSQLAQGIEVHKDYGKLPTIVCNPGEINQVLLSVLVNAIDAMDRDAMDTETVRSKEIFIRTWVTKNKYIHIGIKNTGPSIPAEIQAKIFDPFFTTKPIGTGTCDHLPNPTKSQWQHTS